MYPLIVILHVIVSVALILVILLQTDKGSDTGAVFGGGSSQTLFLAYISGRGGSRSIMKGGAGAPVQSMPAPPAGMPAAPSGVPALPAAPPAK